eukprot:COSAG03_NODE_1407_length_4140_cov_3.756001_8_plen_42_part_00
MHGVILSLCVSLHMCLSVSLSVSFTDDVVITGQHKLQRLLR